MMDSGMIGAILAIIFGVAILLLVLKMLLNISNAREIYKEESEKIKNNYDKTIPYGSCIVQGKVPFVSFDNTNKELIINNHTNIEKHIKYENIVGVELIENGKASLSFGNIIGGSILAGDAGAVIGGMNKKNIVNSIKVKLSLNDFNEPSYEIETLFMYPSGLDSKEQAIIDNRNAAQQIIDTLKFVINNKVVQQ